MLQKDNAGFLWSEGTFSNCTLHSFKLWDILTDLISFKAGHSPGSFFIITEKKSNKTGLLLKSASHLTPPHHRLSLPPLLFHLLTSSRFSRFFSQSHLQSLWSLELSCVWRTLCSRLALIGGSRSYTSKPNSECCCGRRKSSRWVFNTWGAEATRWWEKLPKRDSKNGLHVGLPGTREI